MYHNPKDGMGQGIKGYGLCPIWMRLYMFVVEVSNFKDETLHLVILMSRILIAHLT